jgi:hypothetical protein
MAKKPQIPTERKAENKYLDLEATTYALKAVIDISTLTPFGKPLTATVSLAG